LGPSVSSLKTQQSTPSPPPWLAEVMTRIGRDNSGTLPNFGAFNISQEEKYDRYLGVQKLMPFAKGVSAKSYGLCEIEKPRPRAFG
jgi:hypothetical protein